MDYEIEELKEIISELERIMEIMPIRNDQDKYWYGIYQQTRQFAKRRLKALIVEESILHILN